MHICCTMDSKKRMKRISKKEGIAIAVSLVVVAGFLPSIFVSSTATDTSMSQTLNSFSASVSNSAENTDTNLNIDEILKGFEVTKVNSGTGREAKFGDIVSVHYVATLEDGKRIDTSIDREPYTFVLGQGSVIPGWDLGLIGMQKGEARHLVVPPALAYGDEEVTASDGTVIIPKNSTLEFDVLLVDLKEGQPTQ